MNTYSMQQALETILPKHAVQKLVTTYGNIYDVFFHSERAEWMQLEGVGSSSYKKLEAMRNIVSEVVFKADYTNTEISSPEMVFNIVRDMQYLDVENIRVIYLNTKNQIKVMDTLAIGTLTCASLGIREIFSKAVKIKAAYVILVHNHPSGNPKPSQDDKQVTKQAVEAGKLLGVPVVDHIIIGNGKYFSFADEDLL